MNELQSLLFYVTSFSLSAFLYRIYCKKGKKIFLVFAFLIPLLIGGLRYGVGTDYFNYLSYYENGKYIDQGFDIISGISRQIGDYKTMFFIYNALTTIFLFLGLRNIDKKYRPLTYFCLLFMFFTASFNAMRQILSVCMIFYAYKYALDKKIVPFIIVIALAMLFHSTAVFGILLYALLNIKSKKIKAIIALLSLFAVLNYQNVIDVLANMEFFSHYSMYREYTDSYQFSNSSFVFEIAILIFALFSKHKDKKKGEEYSHYLFIYIIGVILLLSGFINPYLKRIALYFTISSPILLSMSSNFYTEKHRRIIKAAIIVFVLTKFIIQAYALGQSDIIPYQFVEF